MRQERIHLTCDVCGAKEEWTPEQLTHGWYLGIIQHGINGDNDRSIELRGRVTDLCQRCLSEAGHAALRVLLSRLVTK